MIDRIAIYCALAITVGFFAACRSTDQHSNGEPAEPVGSIEASGTITPQGPLETPPIHVDAGEGCIVELTQSYDISGTLSGSATIDYRILVYGPFGSPPGTYDEEWIAHGTFTGTVNESAVSGSLSYLARVKAGVDVEGRILLGKDLKGDLRVFGNFGDGRLSYIGWVK